MRILVFTKYSYEGPSSRYRYYNYKECFAKEGIEMEISPLFGRAYFTAPSKVSKALVALVSYLKRLCTVLGIVIFKKKYALLLLEYELFPYLPAWFEWLLYKRGIRYIVDYDDAIFHKYDMHRNVLVQRVLREKIAKVMRCAEEVIVCNGYLESYAKRYSSHITRLPTVVLLERYKEAIENFKGKEEDGFVVGWIGSRTTSHYIVDILPAMERFAMHHGRVCFELVGFDGTLLSEEEIEKCNIRVVPWEEKREIENILAFDVGIMPLHDDPWSRGKCGFKLIQYMSCKKPVVASPVGINTVLVTEGQNGFLADKVEEWFDAFEQLYADDGLRAKMAANNFNMMENEYNHLKNCHKYIMLIRQKDKTEC